MEQRFAILASEVTAAWAFVAIGFLALVILAYVAVRSRTRRVDLEKAAQAFRAFDIKAFRNLVDPREEEFLRDNLPPGKFRQIKRQRTWAALTYTWEAGRAATALAQIGQAAQQSSDPTLVASGAQLTENAFRLRLQTTKTSLRLLTEMALPDMQLRSIPLLFDQYEQSAETLFRIGRVAPGASVFANSKSA